MLPGIILILWASGSIALFIMLITDFGQEHVGWLLIAVIFWPLIVLIKVLDTVFSVADHATVIFLSRHR